ncbi:lysophospholipid acyltransferase family protein [Cephaloticoccus primus]|uniref:lysophospholipid acyltransferase family protein n=1 Tax=Cephaloticoccus primus TaxID=1548207 RepID=UPI0018D2C210|nr:lysophospholipid acyltransferase family protein [Cephaloticoccus primus]
MTPDAAARSQTAPLRKKEGSAPPKAFPVVISGWRRALLWPLGALVQLWGRTLRFETDEATLRALQKRDEPVAFVLWHNRLFLTPEVFRRYRHGRPLYALVSASKDGAWLTAFFSLVGLRAVRGSSSRLGREAVGALVDVLRAGNDVGITPDGPRGPCYTLKPGALIVARRTQTPLLLLGARFESTWRLSRAWDRFYLPKPFSRVRLHCELVNAAELADRDAAAARLETRLREISPDQS